MSDLSPRLGNSLFALLAIAGALVLAAPATAEGRKLSGAEIRSLLPRASIYRQSSRGRQLLVRFQADGTMMLASDRGYTDTGRWTLMGDVVCSKWTKFRGARRACFNIFHDGGDSFRFVGLKGRVVKGTIPEGETLLAGAGAEKAEAESQTATAESETGDISQRLAKGQEPTDAQLKALLKQLRERNLLASPEDTELPLIRARVPEAVEVGHDRIIDGLVGDEGSPPRLKVDGVAVPLFRPPAGEAPLARHTMAFKIDIDASQEGERRYLLEACDAAGNCLAEEIAVQVVAVNRPDLRARNFALVIGNDDYDELPDLKTAVADASALAEVLTERYAFEPQHVRLLLNAGRTQILRALSTLRSELRGRDRLLLYYAGHGQIDAVTEQGFWQPSDAVADEDFTWISNDDIKRYLKAMPARHVLVIADSCFSGSLTRGVGGGQEVAKDRYFTEVDAHISRTVISSGGTEPVADSGSGGHSVFAFYLLKALRENDQPYITSFELFNRLARAVTNNSRQKPEYGTVAGVGDEGAGDFTFIMAGE